MPTATKETSVEKQGGIENYYRSKIAELEVQERDRTQNLRRLEAQRNDLNSKGKNLFFFQNFVFFFFFFEKLKNQNQKANNYYLIKTLLNSHTYIYEYVLFYTNGLCANKN